MVLRKRACRVVCVRPLPRLGQRRRVMCMALSGFVQGCLRVELGQPDLSIRQTASKQHLNFQPFTPTTTNKEGYIIQHKKAISPPSLCDPKNHHLIIAVRCCLKHGVQSFASTQGNTTKGARHANSMQRSMTEE